MSKLNALLFVTSVFFLVKCVCCVSYDEQYSYSDRRFPQDFPEIFGIIRHPIQFESGENQHIYRRYFRDQGRPAIQRRSMPIVFCPEELDRLDFKTGLCHTLGTQGPCGPHMIFTGNDYLDPNDRTFGHCECDYDRYDHPLVSVGGQCHFLYSQALCLPGYWLTLSKNLGPICKPNPCISKTRRSSGSPFVLYQGECVKLNMRSGLCPRKDDVITFPKGSTEPTCTRAKGNGRRIRKRQLSKTRPLRCAPGFIKSIISHSCVKSLWQSSASSQEP